MSLHARAACPHQRRRPDAAIAAARPTAARPGRKPAGGPLREVLPAVTCTAQATMLTGTTPERHGVVANGWLFRDTNEVRFWQQSNRLIQAEPLYQTARRRAAKRNRSFKSAKLFWWFNQGAAVDMSVTPKPHYAARRQQGLRHPRATRRSWRRSWKSDLGPFPFFSFWGPAAGLPCTPMDRSARRAGSAGRTARPIARLSAAPRLRPAAIWAEGVRHGETGRRTGRRRRAAARGGCRPSGARVWVVSEYGHVDVSRPVYRTGAA